MRRECIPGGLYSGDDVDEVCDRVTASQAHREDTVRVHADHSDLQWLGCGCSNLFHAQSDALDADIHERAGLLEGRGRSGMNHCESSLCVFSTASR